MGGIGWQTGFLVAYAALFVAHAAFFALVLTVVDSAHDRVAMDDDVDSVRRRLADGVVGAVTGVALAGRQLFGTVTVGRGHGSAWQVQLAT